MHWGGLMDLGLTEAQGSKGPTRGLLASPLHQGSLHSGSDVPFSPRHPPRICFGKQE